MKNNEKKFLRLRKAAALYDVNERWLRTACLTKKVKAVKVGRLWYVRPEDMEALFGNAK
mgnify:FL=1